MLSNHQRFRLRKGYEDYSYIRYRMAMRRRKSIRLPALLLYLQVSYSHTAKYEEFISLQQKIFFRKKKVFFQNLIKDLPQNITIISLGL